jgi:serine/threonine protein kinase/tetratricopeptide (TPR) repeat protein
LAETGNGKTLKILRGVILLDGALKKWRRRPVNESQIFTSALKLATPAERAAYLDEACAGDPQLRADVEALLRAHSTDPGFLEEPAASMRGTVDDSNAEREDKPDELEQRGDLIGGQYKLLEVIGEGGMGTVYMVQQTHPVKRLVALKLIKPGMDSRQIIARFEAERQALALMDHPNIARVFDAGTIEVQGPPSLGVGRPYFVMELVKGMPLTKYCDEHRLTPKDRLALFIPVCQAIQHAHQKGIIHRDIKPSNVLVALYDGKPVPKVIDFGVAKAAGQQLTEHTLVTGFGAVVGTLEYMSPEQAELNQLDIDTRSDIYSLGVLLYELLTGSPPFTRKELEKAGMMEMLRVIREQEPSKPSTKLSTAEGLPTLAANRGTEPAKLTKLVRGELDWIVMKALEKDRNRRYETANGFAMDVQRYLADEPVQACPPSAGYRLRKFARRNKGPVLAASLVLLAMVLGMTSTAWGLVRAELAWQGEEQQRLAAQANADRAEQGFAKAREAVEHYLKEVTEDPDLMHKHDLHPLRKKLLDAAVPFYQWFTEQKPGEAAWEAKRGVAFWRLAFVRSEMGEKEAAVKDYERMRTIFAKLSAEFPTVPKYRQDLATSHNNLGLMLQALGQWPAAEQAYRCELEILESLAADFPGVPEYRHDLAGGHTTLGRLLNILGQRREAEQAYRRALEIQEVLVADFQTVPQYRQGLAESHNNLGILLADLGQRPGAEQAHRRALDIREKLAADFPDVPEYRRDLAASHTSQGLLWTHLGQGPAAEQAHRRALDIYEKLAAGFPKVPDYRRDLADSHNNLGMLLASSGQRPAAEQAYRRALEIQEKLTADFPDMPRYRKGMAGIHNNLGRLLADLGQRPAAEQAYRRALEIQEKLAADFPVVPEYRQDLAKQHGNLGILLKNLGRLPAAEQADRRALELFEKLAADFPLVPTYHQDLASSYVNFGVLLGHDGKTEASLAWFAKAIALLDPLLQQEPRLVTARLFLRNAHFARAQALDKLARHADAVKDWDRAIDLAAPPNRPRFRMQRALSLVRAGRHAEAVAEGDALAEAKDVTGDMLYDLACVSALAAAAVKDAKTPSTDATQPAEGYAARAVELLRQAVAKGYKDAAHMTKDRDLDALRGREDFKKLLTGLEKR